MMGERKIYQKKPIFPSALCFHDNDSEDQRLEKETRRRKKEKEQNLAILKKK